MKKRKWTVAINREKLKSLSSFALTCIPYSYISLLDKKDKLTHSFVHIRGCIQLSFSKDSWINHMEEKSKGEKPFWVHTKGVSRFRINAILCPPNWNKIIISMSLDVYSFNLLSHLKSKLNMLNLLHPTNPWNFFSILKMICCIQSNSCEQTPLQLLFLFPLFHCNDVSSAG